MNKRFLLLALLFLPSCFSLNKDYIEADRATFNVIAPIINTLSDMDPTNDPDLTGVNSAALTQLIVTWGLRIDAAEKALVTRGDAQ